MSYTLHPGDCLESMRAMPDGSARCCITSPPYWGLRDYVHDGQLGLEETPDAYVEKMVEVFREVKRVLADDGTLWLNIGDSYASMKGAACGVDPKDPSNSRRFGVRPQDRVLPGLKQKDLVGIPWRLAFALQADGWYLRQDIIWHKPNPMPESVRDRCTKAHEYVFLITKSKRYYYDREAVMVDSEGVSGGGFSEKYAEAQPNHGAMRLARPEDTGKKNKRSVWTVNPASFAGAHFAVMPEALVEPCVLAGSAEGDTILDPFAGSGTVGVVAGRAGRSFVGCELNPEYLEIARQRIEAAEREHVAPSKGTKARPEDPILPFEQEAPGGMFK